MTITEILDSLVRDFESYAADAEAAMKGLDKGDPVYLVLEGVLRDRTSSLNQVRNAADGIRRELQA